MLAELMAFFGMGWKPSLEEALREAEYQKSLTPVNQQHKFEVVIRWPPLGQTGYNWFWTIKKEFCNAS